MNEDINKQALQAYKKLQIGLIVISVLFCLIPLIGWAHGIELRGALSDYYHPPRLSDRGPWSYLFQAEDFFVGALISTAVALFLHRGFDDNEDRCLTLAGVCAVGVVFFPTAFGGWSPKPSFHALFAFAFFGAMAVSIWFSANATLEEHTDEACKNRYKWFYRFWMPLMVVIPAGLLCVFSLSENGYAILIAEWGGTLTFIVYWIVKTIEVEHLLNAMKDAEVTVESPMPSIRFRKRTQPRRPALLQKKLGPSKDDQGQSKGEGHNHTP